MKKVLTVLLAGSMVLSMAGCSGKSEPKNTTSQETTKETAVSGTAEKKDTYKLAFVIPGTDSQYWNQYCGTGAKNAVKDAEKEFGIKVDFELSGPASEGATDEYLNKLEGIIAKKPDMIVTATMQGEGTAPLIKTASEQGIFVNLFTLGIIDGYEDYYGSFYYCDQPEQGKLAANELVRQLNEKKIPLEGVVGMHLATSVPVLEEKMGTFKNTMKEIAPDIKVLDTLYNENDVNKAQANVENQISTYGEKLVGLFGGNNLSGDGIVLAVKNADIQDKIASVAVDSDDLEIEGLENGTLGAIVVQTPYAQAYAATYDAIKAVVTGEKPSEKMVNYPAEVVTKENMKEDKYAALLNPLILAE